MLNPIFSFAAPYVYDAKKSLDDNTDRVPFARPRQRELDRLRQQVLQWCVGERLLNVDKDVITVNVQPKTAGIAFTIYDTNFRVINYNNEQLITFIDMLDDESLHERLKNLSIHLAMSNAPDVVDYQITMIYRSLAAIPPHSSDQLVPWEKVHVQYPYFWVLPLIRMVMVEAAAPISYRR